MAVEACSARVLVLAAIVRDHRFRSFASRAWWRANHLRSARQKVMKINSIWLRPISGRSTKAGQKLEQSENSGPSQIRPSKWLSFAGSVPSIQYLGKPDPMVIG
jgi:hypothetical protein